jgi:hypothetical protein
MLALPSKTPKNQRCLTRNPLSLSASCQNDIHSCSRVTAFALACGYNTFIESKTFAVRDEFVGRFLRAGGGRSVVRTAANTGLIE